MSSPCSRGHVNAHPGPVRSTLVDGAGDIVFLHYPEVRPENWALFQRAATLRGVRINSWMPHLLDVFCTDDGVIGRYAGDSLRPERVVHRTVSSFPGLLVPVLQLWAAEGTSVLNDPVKSFEARDKLLTSLALQRARVPIVPTIAYFEPNEPNLSMLSGDRVILKPGHGVRGEGIRVVSAKAAAGVGSGSVDRRADRPSGGMHCVREHHLAQRLVGGGGDDLRAFVVAGRCLGVMRRSAQPGEIRANLALGASASALAVDHPAAAVAVAAVRACGLDYGGVDLIEDGQGTLRVLEVDAWAGFAGVSRVTGADVAGAILDLALSRG